MVYAVISPGVNFQTSGFRFNGVNDSIIHPGGPHDRPDRDGKRLSGSFWFRRLGDFGVERDILQNTSSRLRFSFRTGNGLRFNGGNSAGTGIFNMDSIFIIEDENLHHVLFSVDLGSNQKHLYIDGINALESGGTYTDDLIDFTRVGLGVGANSGGDVPFNGELAEFWIAYNQYIDFGIKGNREKFFINNQPVFLGIHGEKPTNKVPTMYFSGSNGDKVNHNRGQLGIGKADDWTLTGNPIRSPMPIGRPVFALNTLFIQTITTQDIEGSLLSDSDILNDGFEVVLQLQEIEASTLTDSDTLNHGSISIGIESSLLTDADTLNHGLITLNVESSFLSDADILNHGIITSDIVGSLLEDTDTFNSGEVISAGQLQGSILVDSDTLFEGAVGLPMFGSLLEDADTLNHGSLFIDIMGSLLEDADIFNQGVMGNSRIDGSLFEDSDSLFGGLVEDDLGPVYRIIRIATIVGGGDIVDLVDEVVLASARGALIGKHGVETDDTSV